MSAMKDVTLWCDERANESCHAHLFTGESRVSEALAVGRGFGWHRLGHGHDVCPACWVVRIVRAEVSP